MPLGEASGEELEMTGEARTHTQTSISNAGPAACTLKLLSAADPPSGCALHHG
jgi:hypothetical protein